MTEFQPSRRKADLADVVEMLLDKGVVINADIAVSIGDTQLLGIQVRAAISSFETAARYGLEFPEGTDMRRMAEELGDPEIAEMDRPRVPIDPTRSVNVSSDEDPRPFDDGGDEQVLTTGGESESTDGDVDAEREGGSDDSLLSGRTERGTERLGARPEPDVPTEGGFDLTGDDEDGGSDARETDDGDGEQEGDSAREGDDATGDGEDESDAESADGAASESADETEGESDDESANGDE